MNISKDNHCFIRTCSYKITEIRFLARKVEKCGNSISFDGAKIKLFSCTSYEHGKCL